MESKMKSTIDELFEQWKTEHSELDSYALELANWIFQQSTQRDAQFREAVARLNDLLSRLSAHFAKEQEISKNLVVAQGPIGPEAEAVQRQTDRDHHNIVNRLKHLCDRMLDAESECDAWKSSMGELNLILDLIEQHEEQEAESVGWLLPRKSSND